MLFPESGDSRRFTRSPVPWGTPSSTKQSVL